MTDNCQAATGRRLLTPVLGLVSNGLRCWRRFQQPLTAAVSMLLVMIVVVAGCATNPVTGRSDFVLMSEDDEITLGREYNVAVLKQERRLENSVLAAYVQRVGEH